MPKIRKAGLALLCRASFCVLSKIDTIIEEGTWRDPKSYAQELAQKVENEMEYPGQIKVNVIRETRAIEYAK